MVIVYPTAEPGVVVVVSAVLVMVSPGISTCTLVEQGGALRPCGRLVPGVPDVMVSASSRSPVSGLLTVKDSVIVIVSPGRRLPVHEVVPPPAATCSAPA